MSVGIGFRRFAPAGRHGTSSTGTCANAGDARLHTALAIRTSHRTRTGFAGSGLGFSDPTDDVDISVCGEAARALVPVMAAHQIPLCG